MPCYPTTDVSAKKQSKLKKRLEAYALFEARTHWLYASDNTCDQKCFRNVGRTWARDVYAHQFD